MIYSSVLGSDSPRYGDCPEDGNLVKDCDLQVMIIGPGISYRPQDLYSPTEGIHSRDGDCSIDGDNPSYGDHSEYGKHPVNGGCPKDCEDLDHPRKCDSPRD